VGNKLEDIVVFIEVVKHLTAVIRYLSKLFLFLFLPEFFLLTKRNCLWINHQKYNYTNLQYFNISSEITNENHYVDAPLLLAPYLTIQFDCALSSIGSTSSILPCDQHSHRCCNTDKLWYLHKLALKRTEQLLMRLDYVFLCIWFLIGRRSWRKGRAWLCRMY